MQYRSPLAAIPEAIPRSADYAPGLQWLRAGACAAVLILHAAIPYVATPLPGLTWPVRHADPSRWLDPFFWTIFLVIMPLFFWLSGHGAEMSWRHRGGERFLQTRLRRLGVPFAIAVCVILPIELYIWVGGWVLHGHLPPVKLWSFGLKRFHSELWGPSNFWYLQYLLIYSACFAAWRWWQPVPRPRLMATTSLSIWQQRIGRMASSVEAACVRVWAHPAGLGLLLAPIVLTLWMEPGVSLGFFHGWVPKPEKCLLLGLFFIAGVLTAKSPARSRTTGLIQLAGAVSVLLLVTPIGHTYLQHESSIAVHIALKTVPDRAALPDLLVWGLAGGVGLGMVLLTAGIWNTCQTIEIPPPAPVSRFAEGSYWTYLTHHSLVAAIHVALSRTEWPALTQFLLTLLTTAAICQVTYERMVIGSRLQTLLNGRSSRPAPAPPAAASHRRAA